MFLFYTLLLFCNSFNPITTRDIRHPRTNSIIWNYANMYQWSLKSSDIYFYALVRYILYLNRKYSNVSRPRSCDVYTPKWCVPNTPKWCVRNTLITSMNTLLHQPTLRDFINIFITQKRSIRSFNHILPLTASGDPCFNIFQRFIWFAMKWKPTGPNKYLLGQCWLVYWIYSVVANISVLET